MIYFKLNLLKLVSKLRLIILILNYKQDLWWGVQVRSYRFMITLKNKIIYHEFKITFTKLLTMENISSFVVSISVT
jgi:hypothetical protein